MTAFTGTEQDLVLEVLRHGPLPRSRLARRLGLSAGSLSRLSRALIDDGLLVESEVGTDPGTGRPTRPLDIPLDRFAVVGVNVTGTCAWAVRTDLRGTVTARTSRALEGRSPQDVVAAVHRLVDDLVPGGAPATGAVGVSLGGHVGPEGCVVQAHYLGWESPVDLTGLLQAELGRPAVVGNDLAALTRAEHWFGAGRGVRGLGIITVGAGVGYGLVLDDRVVETPDTGLQLLGHQPLDPHGPRCPLGHRGCASALLTTGALEATGSLALERAVGVEELLDLAEAGHPAARLVVEDAAGHLGRLVATVAGTTTVERVLVTGEGVRLARVAAASLRAGWTEYRDPAAAPLDVVVREHDFHAWARGAAGMAARHYASTPVWFADARSA